MMAMGNSRGVRLIARLAALTLAFIMLLAGCASPSAPAVQTLPPSSAAPDPTQPSPRATATLRPDDLGPIEAFVTACYLAFGGLPESLTAEDAQAMGVFVSAIMQCAPYLLPHTLTGEGMALVEASALAEIWFVLTPIGDMPAWADAQLLQGGFIQGGAFTIPRDGVLEKPEITWEEGDLRAIMPDGNAVYVAVRQGRIASWRTEKWEEPDQISQYGHPIPKIAYIQQSTSVNSKHYGENAFDGDDSSSWITLEGDAQQAWIRVHFTKTYRINALRLVAGDPAGEDAYREHGRPRALAMLMDGETEVQLGAVSQDGPGAEQIFRFDPVEAQYIHITVTDAIKGKRHEDIAIAEVEFMLLPEEGKDD